MPKRSTARDMLWFFLPLIFTAELLQISASVANAVLARMPDPEISLAAYAVAYAVFTLLGSPVWSVQFVALSYSNDKASFWRVFNYKMRIVYLLWAVGAGIGFTPFGDWLFGTFFGASEAVVTQARPALLVLMLGLPSAAVRGVGYALMMKQRRTSLVTAGTVVRFISLSIIIFALTQFSTQAVIGAIALASAMSLEALYCAIMSRPFYQQLPDGTRGPSYLELWRFDWPLMISQTSENTVPNIINFFLGRLANADLALAAFGVMWGVVLVLMNPLRNLVQAVQTLVNSQEELRTMLRFTFRVSAFFSVLTCLLFWSPAGPWFLEHVMGLNEVLRATTLPAFRCSFLLAFLWGYSSLSRGLLSRLRRTGFIAYGSLGRIAACFLIGSASLLFPNVNGALLGIFGWVGAQAAETIILGLRVMYYQRQAPLFAAEEAALAPEAAAEAAHV